jgi:hypothetical protein
MGVSVRLDVIVAIEITR